MVCAAFRDQSLPRIVQEVDMFSHVRAMDRQFDHLRVEEVRPQIAVITLNRPDRLNALSWALIDDLHDALEAISRDNRLRAVVLTGEGRAFCAGLDLTEHTGSSRSEGLTGPAGGMRSQEHVANLMLKLRSIPQPVIAAINGVAVGGGFALTLYSDIRLAAESARFSVQFIKVGLSGCDVGVSYALPRLIGASPRVRAQPHRSDVRRRRGRPHRPRESCRPRRRGARRRARSRRRDPRLLAVRSGDDQGSAVGQPLGVERGNRDRPREPHADPGFALRRLRRSRPCVHREAPANLRDVPPTHRSSR